MINNIECHSVKNRITISNQFKRFNNLYSRYLMYCEGIDLALSNNLL